MPRIITKENLVENLGISLNNILPGIDAHRRMIPLNRGDRFNYFNKDQVLRDAAVLIILFFEKDKLKTVFIERTPDAGPHSGQIAFPGGRREDFDADLIETALREADEEIGIKVNRENVLGSLTPLQIPISGFSVLPVIAFVDSISEFNACEIEVNNIFVVDVIELLNSKDFKTLTVHGIEIHTPCYVFDNQIVWGATAMVLSELEEVLSA